MIRSSFSRLAVALTAGFLAAAPVHADTTLGAGQYRLVGASFDVTPATQTVPVGIPATVRTVFSGQVAGLAENGLRVAAELSGPGVPSPVTLSTVPGGDLLVPALSVKGEYRLDNIRLTDGARTLAPAATPTVHIVVSDVLITQVTSRALTTEELLARGVILTDANYKAFSFAVGLAIQGRTITVELPTMVETRNGYMPMGSPRVDIGNAAEGFTPPRIVAIPLEPIPGAGLPSDREEFVEESAAPTPVFGFLVFPGNIRFLNQFFSVVLMVQNGAPQGSTLSLSNLTTTVSLPTTSLRLSKTIPSVPDGAPVPVRNAGPDEVLGTADDVTVLVAQATGSAEFVTEGLRVGTHEVECLIEATLNGLANQPARQLSGRARGSVVVRDPSFSMSFNHPDVVRDGEEYELRVTVANTSTVQANQVTVAIDAASLSGVEALDFLPGVNPNAALGDLPAGTSALVKFRMRARRTGRVVASAFTSDGAVTGSVVLRTAVTNDGTPLSPDSFVFPRFLSSLPPAVVDPATALIGIAHGLATMDPTAPGQNGCNVDNGGLAIDCLAPFADGIVQERVVDLVEAARRASLNQPVPSAVADVAFAWLGSELASPGFDKVRRRNNHGASLDAGIAVSLSEHAGQVGVNGLTTLLLDAAVANAPLRDVASPLAGPAFVVLEGGSPSNPAARLVLADPATTLATGFVVSENAARRDLPYSSVYPLAGAGGVEVGLLGRTPAGGYLVHIQGRTAGSVRATAFFPDGQGGFRKLDLGNVAIQPGSMATVQVVPGATSALLTSNVEAARTVTAVAAIPSPFAGIAAVQDLEASPLGRAVSVIFNRRTALSSQDLTRYRLPGQKPNGTAYDRNVLGAFRQTDTRRVVVVAEATISPVRPGFLEGSSIPAELSATWTGSLPIVARLQAEGGTVEGRVIGPEGTPLPNAPVQLTESATDDLTGTVFQAATSVTRTDGTGNYFFDFVRKQDGKPFRVDSFDGSTGSKGYAVGQIRTDRSTVQVDIVLQGRGRVQGRVLSGPEQPLAGVIVRCSSVNDPNFRLAMISRADGTFGFDSVPVGTVQLQAEDPLTNRTSYATAALTAPGHVVNSDLLLTQLPRTSLRGTVLHGGNGQRYANVYVAGYGASGEYFGVRLTGADGTFAFSTVPVGNVRLELFDLAVSGGAILVQPLTLVADQPAEVTVTVPETVRHFGSASGFVKKVVNGAQQPAAGVVVYERDSGIRTTTAADGSFLLDGLEVGTRQITALVPASGRTTSVSVGILENQPANVLLLFPDFTLGTIAGVVTDQTGARRAGAKVEIWRADGLSTIAEAISATDGSFVLPNVPVGTHRVQATILEQRGSVQIRNAGAQTAVIASAGGSTTVTLQMRGFLTVTGRVIARVRDRNGNLNDNPVFAPVELSSGRFYDGNPQSTDPEAGPVFLDGPVFHSRTNSNSADGTFTFTLVHGGPIRVTAKNPFYGDKTYDFGSNVIGDGTRGPVDLVFDGNLGFVDGFLLNADGTPIVGGRVTLTGAGVEMEALSRAATVDVAAGYFVFPLVPFRSPLRLEYRGAVLGKDRFAEGYASISAAAPLARVTLRALPLGTVTTRVVKRSGNDYVNVPNAQVLVKETAGPLRQFVMTTDANGLASFDDVTAGSIAVSAKEGLLGAKASLLGAGEGFRVEAVLTLTGVGRVTGTVREPGTGAPAGNVNVVLHSLGGAGFPIGPVAAATTDASGTYDFPDLPAGPGAGYRLFAEDSRTLRSGSSGSFPLQVDEIKVVDVSFVPIGVVTGRVTTFDGAVIYPGITVRVKSGDGPYLEATTGVDGVYRVEGVAAGLVSATATDELTGLTANAQGTLETEGQVLSLDLRTRPSGRVQGVVRQADGTPVALMGPQPSVRLDSRISQTVLSGAYDFSGVDATIPFRLTATEPVAPFHIGQLSSTVGAGEVKQLDVSYGPIGSLRVHARKADPANPGQFLPVAGIVRVGQGGPYVDRFPSGAPFRTDASGDVLVTGVGGGFGLRVSVTEDGTGNGGSTTLDLTGETTQDITVVVAPRGLVRGRVLTAAGGAPLAGATVGLYGFDFDQRTILLGTQPSGPDGRFEFRDVTFGSVFVSARTLSPIASSLVPGTISLAAPTADLGDIVPDAVRPFVVSSDPVNGATGVGLNPTLRFTFSEPILPYDPYSFAPVNLYRHVTMSSPFGAFTEFETALDATGTVLTVTVPVRSLVGNSAYEVRLSSNLRDRAGLEMGADHVLRFTTADLTNPTLVTSQPVSGQVQVRVDLNPTVVLSKALDAATLVAGVHLNRLDAPAGAVSIAPSLQADGRTIILNPAANLAAEGEYEILLDAVKDTAGNPLLAPIRIPFATRDDVAPVASLDAPDTLTPYESTFHTYTVRWTADDVKTVSVSLVTAVGQQQLTTFSPPRADRSRSQSLGIPRLGAAGGPLVLVRAVLTDLSGNTSQIVEQPLTIQADLPPAIASAAIEGSASVARNATFTLVLSGTDDTDLTLFEVTPPAGVTFLSSSTSGTPTSRTDRYNYRVNLSAAAGPVVFAVKARDRLLQYSPVSNVTLTVLDDASPTVTIVSPTTGSFLSGSSIPVQLVVGDDLGVATLRLTLGASIKDVASPAGTVSTTITAPTVAASGTVPLIATVTDTTGHVTNVSVNLTIQPDAPPTIAVTAPAANAHFTTGTTISVTGTLTDDNSSATLLATFAGSTRSASTVGGFALTFTAPNVAVPTSYDLVLTAQDNTGHTATPVTVPVVIDPDTISPTVSVATPAEAQDVVGGTLFVLVATASDNVAVKTFRYRIAGGSWISVPGATVSTTVLAPAVASNTNLAIELEATDYADRVTALMRTVRVVPNQAPVVVITQPTAGRRITAGTVYTVSGTVTDDSGLATVTVTDGATSPSAQAPAGTWSFPFTAPSVSSETPLTISVTARDPQNVTSTPRTVLVTIVPDVGGTPTVTLAPPAPAVLLVGTTTGVPILFGDNVGLSSGTAEVTGPFASAGVQTYSLSGLSATRTVPVTFTSRPFGESSRVVAQNVDLGGRSASLDVSLPVAYHRLETALAAGPYLEGGTIAGTFRISAEGRARASVLKLEIGTVGAGGFTTLTCVQRSAPLAELETLTVTVPSGQTGLYLRSVLVESTTGLVAPAAKADGLGLFLDAIATTADATGPGLVIASPTAGDTFPSGSLVTVSATATDNVRVASIDVAFDGITKTCAGGSCNVTFWAPTVATSTAMTITVTARDGGNRTDVKTVSVTITAGGGVASEAPPEPVVRGDGQPPRLKVLAPALEDSPVAPGAPFTPVVEASDADGIATVTYVLEGLGEPVPCLVQKAGRASASEACHVPELPEGTRLTLRIVATDRTGETSEEVASLVVRNGVRLTTKQVVRGDDRDLTGRVVYVESDVELRGTMDVETLIVRPFASLRPIAGEALRVRAANDIVVETLGTLEASALGAPGARPDSSSEVLTLPGAGGAHGGNGGETPAFDSPFVPSLPGAGGGFDALHSIPGGAGGGVIDVLATRILVAGHVRADGEESISVGAGAGAGGTLRLVARHEIRTQEAHSLALSGFLSVRGGSVPPEAPVRSQAGGGRIALEAPNVDVPLYDVSGTVSPASRGAAGTLFVRDEKRPRGVLVLDGGAPESVPVAATQMPSVGCGLVAEGKGGSLRALRPLPLGLGGLLLEIGQPAVRLLRVASNDTTHLWLDVPKGDPVLTLLSGQPYCGVLQLDELHLLGGARAAFLDRLDVAPREIHVDSTSTLEKP